jgi:hypothetical protein
MGKLYASDIIHIVLSIMTAQPKHQYRGAGTMMMKWGTDLADEIGAMVCQTEITRSSI